MAAPMSVYLAHQLAPDPGKQQADFLRSPGCSVRLHNAERLSLLFPRDTISP